jgi:hypothetical protein
MLTAACKVHVCRGWGWLEHASDVPTAATCLGLACGALWHMPAGLHDCKSLCAARMVHAWELALHACPGCASASRVVRKPLVILVSSQHGCCGESVTACTRARGCAPMQTCECGMTFADCRQERQRRTARETKALHGWVSDGAGSCTPQASCAAASCLGFACGNAMACQLAYTTSKAGRRTGASVCGS